jgi:hypothetical protein
MRMRIISLYLGVPAAAAMMAVSMGCNWLYLTGFGKTWGVILLLSAASIAIDVLKALAPFWLNEAWKAVHIGRGLAALIVLVFCVAVSLASALGFLAEMHAGSVGRRQVVNDRHAVSKAHVEDLKGQLARLVSARPVGVIEAAIAAGRHDARWTSSKGCTRDTAQSSREFCLEQGSLDTELSAARASMELRGQIADAGKTIKGLEEQGAGQDSDPRGSLIGRFTGFSAAEVSYGIELCLAILVEFAAAFGLFLALEGAKAPPTPRRIEPDLEVVAGTKRRSSKRAAQGSSRAARRIRFGGKGGS